MAIEPEGCIVVGDLLDLDASIENQVPCSAVPSDLQLDVEIPNNGLSQKILSDTFPFGDSISFANGSMTEIPTSMKSELF